MQELPTDPKFEVAKRRISEKYDAIERNLIEDFNAAHKRAPPDKAKMKSCATSLSHFKGKSKKIPFQRRTSKTPPSSKVTTYNIEPSLPASKVTASASTLSSRDAKRTHSSMKRFIQTYSNCVKIRNL